MISHRSNNDSYSYEGPYCMTGLRLRLVPAKIAEEAQRWKCGVQKIPNPGKLQDIV